MAVTAFAKEEKSEGAPLNNSVSLILQATKKPNGEMMRLNDGPFISLNTQKTDPDKQVSMAVGDDGNLWLKRKDGNWKKVVTE
jgi:hypothetical protein